MNSPRARIGWEHTHREVLADLILANRLQAAGWDAELSQLQRIAQRPLEPDVFCLPYFYDDVDVDRLLTPMRGGRQAFINMSYEQMHFRCGREYILPTGDFARAQMVHCAWGKKYRGFLLGHGIPDERIHIVGHPRFDIYHQPSVLFDWAELAAASGLDPNKPWVLVPYNFNLSYVTPPQIEALRARDYDLQPDFIAGFTTARDAFTQMNDVLAGALPDAEIILRVHPAGFESEDVYRGLSKRWPNLHLIGGWDIANWITQAAVVVVWNSTSAVEAMVAGVPVLSYEPEPFSERFEYDLNRILPTFSRRDDVVDRLQAAVAGDPLDLTYDWALFEAWYAHRDGGNADRMVSLIQTVAADHDRYGCHWDGLVSPARAMRSAWLRWRRRGLSVPAFGDLDPETVRGLVDSLDVHPVKDLLR